ncbi:metal-dependent hydrolase [Candidatus Magnetominusculus dajiuhuensis]|uniref:metal-dependent hydrolase n=1 Tax=Candidatus Magnetominusculus dajiuhuensis TaxID=3137712 RepID=UPI003B42CDE7
MIAGHVACSYVVQRALRLRPVNIAFLFVASYLPDIADKTIAIVFGMSGRGYFHSLTVMFALYALAYIIISKVRPDYRIFVHLGALYYALHLTFDWTEWEILFWPFLGPVRRGGHFSPLEHLNNYYVLWQHPGMLSAEITFITIFIIIKIKDLKANHRICPEKY